MHERLGFGDLLAEKPPRELPMEPAQTPGPADGEREDGQPEEGDGQHHARPHCQQDKGESESGQRSADREEPELRPGPLRKWLVPDDAGELLGAVSRLLRDDSDHLLHQRTHPDAGIPCTFPGHASRRCSTSIATPRVMAQ